MYRDEADLQLLAELAGVLDETVTANGLSPGTYVVLRALVVAEDDPSPVTAVAERLRAGPDEVAALCGRLVQEGFAETRPNGVVASEAGKQRVELIDGEANEAMRAYVLERPHTATVYGLVAAMQSGRFTVVDLLEMLAEGPTETEGAAVPVNGLDLRFGAPSHDGSGHRGCADERARLSFVHRPQGVGIEGCTLRSRARRDLASRIEIDNLTTNHSNSASCECRARRNPQLPCDQCRVVSLRVDREDAERFGQQGVPGQNGHSFAVHDVGGWATAAQRVVIH